MGHHMESHRTKASRRLLRDIKDEAKSAARSGYETHSQALERLSREHGYSSWNELHQACDSQPALPALTSPAGHPIDPPLRLMFDQTPNEERTEWEVERWWSKPYILTRPDGGFDVRCLDGGAWDRSTWYGNAATLEECDKIAEVKLARWREFQNQPYTSVSEDGSVRIVRLPWRPHLAPEVLHVAKDFEEAKRYLDGLGVSPAGVLTSTPPPKPAP